MCALQPLFLLFAQKLKIMTKYNKINREQVLQVFQEKPVVKRADITNKYGCSVYSVRQHIDDLMDEQVVRATKYGYRRVEASSFE